MTAVSNFVENIQMLIDEIDDKNTRKMFHEIIETALKMSEPVGCQFVIKKTGLVCGKAKCTTKTHKANKNSVKVKKCSVGGGK